MPHVAALEVDMLASSSDTQQARLRVQTASATTTSAELAAAASAELAAAASAESSEASAAELFEEERAEAFRASRAAQVAHLTQQAIYFGLSNLQGAAQKGRRGVDAATQTSNSNLVECPRCKRHFAISDLVATRMWGATSCIFPPCGKETSRGEYQFQ
jgi:hypothetical protein